MPGTNEGRHTEGRGRGWATTEIASARERVARVLDALDIDAYLYEVEPRDDGWEVHVEWSDGDRWASRRLTIPAGELVRLDRDPLPRNVVEVWRGWLMSPKRR